MLLKLVLRHQNKITPHFCVYISVHINCGHFCPHLSLECRTQLPPCHSARSSMNVHLMKAFQSSQFYDNGMHHWSVYGAVHYKCCSYCQAKQAVGRTSITDCLATQNRVIATQFTSARRFAKLSFNGEQAEHRRRLVKYLQ